MTPRTIPWGMVAVAMVVATLVAYLLVSGEDGDSALPSDVRTKKAGKVARAEPVRPVEAQGPSPGRPRTATGMEARAPEERTRHKEGRRAEAETSLAPASSRVFATGTEQIMAWIFNTTPGDLPPPLPKIPDGEYARLAEILLADNPVAGGDSENVAQAKARVRQVKRALAEYIGEGGTPGEFFRHYRGELRRAHVVRSETQRAVLRQLREEPELALDFLNAANRDLEARGIRPIALHPRQLQHFGIVSPNQD